MSKNILIIGSNRGIGLEFCKQYKELGYNVFAVCRNLSAELTSLDVNVIDGIDVNLNSDLTLLRQKLSGNKFTKLIHVAGIMNNESVSNFNIDTILKQFMVNSLAPINTIINLLELLDNPCRVGVLTSRMGSIGDNESGGYYGYRMSKSALNAGLKSLSIDLKPQNISIAVLHPGWVKTDMTNFTGHLNVQESVVGMIQLMDKLNIQNSGTFWHTNGEILSW